MQPETLFAPVESSLESVTTAEQLVVASSKDFCDNHIYDTDGYLNTVLFDNGYISSGQYHFYIKDYQGNNRVVFDQNGDVEQVNHYYPYGGTFGEGLGFNDVQPYKYGGKELDRMNGLDMYDFGARHLDSSKGSWNGLDPMAEKYYNISPYAYCAGNPILNIDPKGDSIAVLNAGSGANQHMAILIQNKDGKWGYYSVNGNNMYSSGSGSTSESSASSGDSSFTGGKKNNDEGEQLYNSPQDFLKSEEGSGYAEAYVIGTSAKQDKKIRSSFLEGSRSDYNLVTNNCATTVQQSLNSAGIKVFQETLAPITYGPHSVATKTSYAPSEAFNIIKMNNPNGKYLQKKKK